MSKDSSKDMFGKPWTTHSTHTTYDDANVVREDMLISESLQVKVRRYADNTYRVRTRSLPTATQKKRKQKADKAKRKKERQKRG